MDSHTHSAQFARLEVVDTGRRRRWTPEEKERILAESMAGPRLVSATARRHGISTSLLHTWRRECRVERVPSCDRQLEGGPSEVPPIHAQDAARIEVALPNGIRVNVDYRIHPVALKRFLRAFT